MDEIVFENESVRLHVGRSGEGPSPAIVLLHGVTRRWQDFLPIWPYLASRYQVHAIDFRGHGKSSHTPGAYRVIDYVPDIIAYVRDVIQGPVTLLGHSLGAMVAAAVAAEVPERVGAVILEDPTFEMTGTRMNETAFPDLFRAFQTHAGSDRSVTEIARELAEARVYSQGGGFTVRLGEVRDMTALRFSAACLRHLDPEVLTVPLAGRWLDGFPVEPTLRRLACPTLMLQSSFTLGGALPDEYASELASLIADGVHIKMPDVGHNIHGSQAEGMMRLVLNFLGSLD